MLWKICKTFSSFYSQLYLISFRKLSDRVPLTRRLSILTDYSRVFSPNYDKRHQKVKATSAKTLWLKNQDEDKNLNCTLNAYFLSRKFFHTIKN